MAIPVDGSAAGPSTSGFTALLDAIRARHFAQLADILDTSELEIAASGASKPQDWPYAVHVLAHVVNHDLNSARFVWKRTPVSVKESSPELVAAWKIVQNMWTHDHAGVYKALKGFDWTELVQPITGAIGDNYSTSMLRLLSTAYSTVSVADASGFLGLSENETVTFLTQQHGWVLDPASQMLTVRPMSTVSNKKTDSSQLQNLTEYVFHLEH
ncbi:hypothetical protein KC19_6G177700 [Ceratodon purpureus]|uniref:CSN8/PSMD8/EIF3K domain-containing protein n=1 Tax=Ceratodon purpureus TaxID=3225 RepID=A0A8T0HFW0_CERPU|nr:hypothetical protein KC19_6G177700 [Ceratodon purpureus]